jgi:hypothetical protein
MIVWLVPLDTQLILTALIITLVLHPLTNIVAYVFRIKKVWW